MCYTVSPTGRFAITEPKIKSLLQGRPKRAVVAIKIAVVRKVADDLKHPKFHHLFEFDTPRFCGGNLEHEMKKKSGKEHTTPNGRSTATSLPSKWHASTSRLKRREALLSKRAPTRWPVFLFPKIMAFRVL